MTNLADKAKNLMNEVGMTKGKSFDHETGSVCMVGALNQLRVLGEVVDFSAAGTTLGLAHKVIREQFSDRSPNGAVPDFNDHPDTTLADVNVVWEKVSTMLDEAV